MQLYTIHTNSKRPAASNRFNPRHRNCPKVISLLVPKCFTIVRDAALSWERASSRRGVGRSSFTPSEQAPARLVLLGPASSCPGLRGAHFSCPHGPSPAWSSSRRCSAQHLCSHAFVWSARSSYRSMLWIRFRQVSLIPVDPSGKLRLVQKKGKEK